MKKLDKFTLINKDRSRIKVFEPFEDISKPSPSIDARLFLMVAYIKDKASQLCKVQE